MCQLAQRYSKLLTANIKVLKCILTCRRCLPWKRLQQ